MCHPFLLAFIWEFLLCESSSPSMFFHLNFYFRNPVCFFSLGAFLKSYPTWPSSFLTFFFTNVHSGIEITCLVLYLNHCIFNSASIWFLQMMTYFCILFPISSLISLKTHLFYINPASIIIILKNLLNFSNSS